jgi:hypothetical protein
VASYVEQVRSVLEELESLEHQLTHVKVKFAARMALDVKSLIDDMREALPDEYLIQFTQTAVMDLGALPTRVKSTPLPEQKQKKKISAPEKEQKAKYTSSTMAAAAVAASMSEIGAATHAVSSPVLSIKSQFREEGKKVAASSSTVHDGQHASVARTYSLLGDYEERKLALEQNKGKLSRKEIKREKLRLLHIRMNALRQEGTHSLKTKTSHF